MMDRYSIKATKYNNKINTQTLETNFYERLMNMAIKNHFADTIKEAFKLAAKIVGQSADAHDVIQDAATIALSHANAPEQTSDDFKLWFYRVVRNKAIDKVRANNRQQRRSAPVPTDRYKNADGDSNSASIENLGSCESTNPDIQLQAIELQTHIKDALASVSVAHREIVLLKDYHGFSYDEISVILDIAKGSVMSRLHRSRLALRTELTRRSTKQAPSSNKSDAEHNKGGN